MLSIVQENLSDLREGKKYKLIIDFCRCFLFNKVPLLLVNYLCSRKKVLITYKWIYSMDYVFFFLPCAGTKSPKPNREKNVVRKREDE